MMKTLKNRQYAQGSTLMEVMISVFVLTFGILALMLTQIRSVAGVGYAENQTLVAQAAEALAEGMQANPTLSQAGNDAGQNVLMIQYANYHTASKAVGNNTAFKALTEASDGTKNALKTVQLANFEAALRQMPDVESVRYAICQDKENPDEPVMSAAGVFDAKCSAANLASGAVIKVGWVMKSANKRNEKTTFTYMLKVKG